MSVTYCSSELTSVRCGPEFTSISQAYTEYAGGEGSYAFLNVDYDALHFHTGSFSKYSFGREGVTKRALGVCF